MILTDQSGASSLSKGPISIIAQNVVFCDDIRREINGKDILIGVYGSDMVIPSFPSFVGLALFIQIRISGSEITRRMIRVLDTSGNKAGETSLDIAALLSEDMRPEQWDTHIALPALMVTISQPGSIKVLLEQDDGQVTQIGEKRVISGPVANAFVPPLSPPPPVAQVASSRRGQRRPSVP